MILKNQVRNFINLNLATFNRRAIATFGVKIRSSAISPLLVRATDFNKNDFVHSGKQNNCLFKNVNSSMNYQIPQLFVKDILPKIKVYDPRIKEEFNIGIPLNSLLIKDVKLPNLREVNVVEPVGNVVEKKALNIIQIRRRKMRKHKRKKLLRKMRVHFINKKNRKRAKQDKELLLFVTSALDEGQNYNVETHIEEVFEKLKWKPPITRVKGRLAPAWVIKKYSEEEKLKKFLNERIEYCLKKL